MGSGSSVANFTCLQEGDDASQNPAVNVLLIPEDTDLSTDFALVKMIFSLFDQWHFASGSSEHERNQALLNARIQFHSSIDSLTDVDAKQFVDFICGMIRASNEEVICDKPLESSPESETRVLFTGFRDTVNSLLKEMAKDQFRVRDHSEFSSTSIAVDVNALNLRLSQLCAAASEELRGHCLFRAVLVLFLLSVDPCKSTISGLAKHEGLLKSLSNRDSHHYYDGFLQALPHLVDKLFHKGGVWQSKETYGVSLSFLLEFLEEHKDVIGDKTTTAEVVSNIIVPATAESKLTYLEDKLLHQHPAKYADLSKRGL